MSPSDANEASTPPVVGSVSTLMNGIRASSSRASAATVFASCMSAMVPSCIRAPPEAETMTSGLRSAKARSAARVSFSPTTLPIEPPMNSKSITARTIGIPEIVASPVRTASLCPLLACAAAMRSGYGLLSTKPSGSDETMSASVSLNDRGSARSSMRPAASSLKWWPHFWHTLLLRSSCLLNSISPHIGHCVQRCEGNSFGLRPKGLRSLIQRPRNGTSRVLSPRVRRARR